MFTLREQCIFVYIKEEIIFTALESLHRLTGINGHYIQDDVKNKQIHLKIEGRTLEFLLEVKTEVRKHQVYQLAAHHSNYPHLIIIAQHIFPEIKEELRELGISYLESNGNVFIKHEQIFLLIDTQKKQKFQKDTANRAFTKTGLKVLFHLLNDKELIHQTQREIARICGVGLGNIPQIIEGLKEAGYLIKYQNNKYVWQRRKELLDHWLNGYATLLRPKLLKGKYACKKAWQDIQLNTQGSAWGGEYAADLLTNYLRPENILIHTKEKQIDLIRNYHIVPQLNGELEVHEIFWQPENGIAPPVIIYAELLLSGGKRNIETAEIIYNEYIQSIL